MKMAIGLVLLWMSLLTPSYAAIEVYDFDTIQQEEQFKALSNTLRCPKCQNNTIADSNAELAKDLRQKVFEMTLAGKSEQEIIDYMVARYGNFVTYNPPFTLSTAILWLAPFSVLLIGFGWIVRRSRKKISDHRSQWDDDKEQRLKSLLESDQQGDKLS
jgi:cytochrome c-type biogenesis protein CcmH